MLVCPFVARRFNLIIIYLGSEILEERERKMKTLSHLKYNLPCVYFQSKVPMSEALLEDLILSLDTDFDNNLDYKELARGLELWKRERRENRRKELSRTSSASSVKTRSSEYE